MRSIALVIWVMLFSFELQAQEVRFSKNETDSLVTYNFINPTFAPVTLTVEKLSDLDITLPSQPIVCTAQDSLVAVISIPKSVASRPDFKSSSHFKTSAAFGKFIEKDSIKDVLYELPFKNGKRYKIIQGFKGTFTHSSEQSLYAIDFKMPIGDTIVAARSGIVIRTVDHFTEHGGKSLRDKSNQILIYHDDGTIAYYVHLDTNGVLVEVGDQVEAGDAIGISGFTGYTTTPHLHFVVRNLRSAIPIAFKNYKNLGKKSGVWAKKLNL